MVECSSVQDEISNLRKAFSQIQIESATQDFISLSYERTRYTRVKANLTFPQGYPQHSLIVTIKSDNVVPAGLKKKLEKELGQVVSTLNDYTQVSAVVSYLINFVNTNLFFPCWKELKQCVTLIQKQDKSTISLFETKGLIKLKLVGKNRYFYSCNIYINKGYPFIQENTVDAAACKLVVTKSNFPEKIEKMLTSQAIELVRRMQNGMLAQDALVMSNPIRPPTSVEKKQAAPLVITQEALKSLKHDTETLQHVRDLRQVNAETKKGNANLKANKAKERKQARRDIAKITRDEIIKDAKLEQKQQLLYQQEETEMDYQDNDSQPSLLSLVTFLVAKIQQLPLEICPICAKSSLPSDPNELNDMYKPIKSGMTADEKNVIRTKRKQRPLRTYCGCWYHHACLDKYMTEPPFGANCPGCDKERVYHPDWPSDPKELERAWAAKQARLREIEDAMMFL